MRLTRTDAGGAARTIRAWPGLAKPHRLPPRRARNDVPAVKLRAPLLIGGAVIMGDLCHSAWGCCLDHLPARLSHHHRRVLIVGVAMVINLVVDLSYGLSIPRWGADTPSPGRMRSFARRPISDLGFSGRLFRESCGRRGIPAGLLCRIFDVLVPAASSRSINQPSQAPSWAPFGTDNLGRDMLSFASTAHGSPSSSVSVGLLSHTRASRHRHRLPGGGSTSSLAR
jgi:hypothetical protein